METKDFNSLNIATFFDAGDDVYILKTSKKPDESTPKMKFLLKEKIRIKTSTIEFKITNNQFKFEKNALSRQQWPLKRRFDKCNPRWHSK